MPVNFQNYRMDDVDRNLQRLGIPYLDIAVVGITGAGKSTTLNAFFQKPVAKEGDGVDPETMMIDSYFLNSRFRIWDTPGLGDSPSQDQNHINAITNLLLRTYQGSYGLIDMVFVILDGSSRDMGGAYHLLNEVLIPNIPAERIFVLINQADFAMKTTQHWNFENQTPDATLKAFLEEKADSIQRRVKEATGLDILRPVYYSAKYGYHVTEVFDFIIDHMPMQKRAALPANNIRMIRPEPSVSPTESAKYDNLPLALINTILEPRGCDCWMTERHCLLQVWGEDIWYRYDLSTGDKTRFLIGDQIEWKLAHPPKSAGDELMEHGSTYSFIINLQSGKITNPSALGRIKFNDVIDFNADFIALKNNIGLGTGGVDICKRTNSQDVIRLTAGWNGLFLNNRSVTADKNQITSISPESMAFFDGNLYFIGLRNLTGYLYRFNPITGELRTNLAKFSYQYNERPVAKYGNSICFIAPATFSGSPIGRFKPTIRGLRLVDIADGSERVFKLPCDSHYWVSRRYIVCGGQLGFCALDLMTGTMKDIVTPNHVFYSDLALYKIAPLFRGSTFILPYGHEWDRQLTVFSADLSQNSPIIPKRLR